VATLEDRVTKLESDVQELRSDVTAGLRAQAFVLSLVHAEVRDVRTDLAGLRGEVGEVRTEMREGFDALGQRMATVESGIAQILERLDRPA
jgi:hypothetical protein